MGLAHSPRIVTDGLVLALDAGNTKSFSPNVFPRGTDIYGWYVDTKGNANASSSTISRDTISSPVGNTPLKMEVTGNDPYLQSYDSTIWNLAAASSGDTWTVSFYVKASQSTTGEVLLFESNGTSYFSVPNTTYNITTSWQRISFTATFSNASTTVIQLRLDGPNSGGAGTTVWWDGLQLERGSTASEFTKSYTLDGSLNYLTVDQTRNGNNGTLTNMDGGNLNTDDGGSLVFDGVNDYISFASASELQFLNRDPYSLEVWMYVDSNPFGSQTYTGIFNREDTSGGSRDGYNLWLHGIDANNVNLASERFASETQSNVSKVYINADFLNMWHHIIVKYDGTNIKLYRNAEEVASNTSTLNITNTSKVLEIGKRNSGSYFNGKLNGQKIYNKALSASEIQQNFNALRGRYGI